MTGEGILLQQPRSTLSYPDGDIILRSIDGVDFQVHKLLLRIASPFFQAMFTLPGSTSDAPIPVIDMVEEADQIDNLLRWIYPVARRPKYRKIESTRSFLRVAEKFEVQCAISVMREALTILVEKEPNPLCQWAIGKLVDDAEMRRNGMIGFIITNSEPSHFKELDEITARDFLGLCDARKCALKQINISLAAVRLPTCGDLTCPGYHVDWSDKFRSKCASNPLSSTIYTQPFLQRCYTTAVPRCKHSVWRSDKTQAVLATLHAGIDNAMIAFCRS